MKVTFQMQIGIGKDECEDSSLVYSSMCEKILNEGQDSYELSIPCIVAVADGVGGNPGGKDASSYVMKQIIDSFPEVKNSDDFIFDESEVRSKIKTINTLLLEYASKCVGKETMATTLTIIFFDCEKLIISHSGNTRFCFMNNKYLKQLTVDHTTYQYLLDTGNIDAANSCNRAEIYSCFGGGSSECFRRLDIKTIQVSSFPNTMLLTSDGIHEYVDIDKFEDIVSNKQMTLQQQTAMLIDEAIRNNSMDDKTIIFIQP